MNAKHKKQIKTLTVVAVIVILAVAVISWVIGVRRTEIGLRSQYQAQESNVENYLDNAWRNISSQFQITENYKDTVIQLMGEVSAGRQGGSLFRSQTESDNPLGLDESIFRDLMASVESHGNRFASEQQKLIDLHNQWRILTQDPVYSFILANVEPIPPPVLIVAGRTREAVESRTGPDSFLN